MSILFIAVQCFQCSTMQVKQQRKSSNKWTCVICNEKQSLRKVHARGYQANHIRKFVQSFNSSSAAAAGHRSVGSGWISSQSLQTDGGGGPDNGRALKRMDWTEYLDPKGEEEEGEGGLRREEFVSVPKMPPPRKRNSQSRPEKNGAVKFQRTATKKKEECKWSKYLEEEEEEEEDGAVGEHLVGRRADDVAVEEEVHPDFRCCM